MSAPESLGADVTGGCCSCSCDGAGKAGSSELGLRDREENPETRASAQLGVQLNLPAKLANNAVHGGKTEASALANRLGDEKRLEDVIARGFVHAATGVGNFEDEPVLLLGFAAIWRGCLREDG